MKTQRFLILWLAGALLQLAFAGGASAYTLLLPDVAAGPCEGFTTLPYSALADHYSGAACVQMILNACPTVAKRACHSQADLYSKILLHNSEPALWFSDPKGIEGTLEDPTLAPCGTWIDFSNTDKSAALGKVLYYLRTQRYLTPVSIGTSEHWVNVIGYETDIEPPYSGAVTLQNIFFYDPLPGNPALGWVSGNTWLGVAPGASGYWAAPLSLAGSAWNGKYIAVIEPPEATVVVRVPRWRRERLLPPNAVLQSVRRWLDGVRTRQLARGGFELLGRDVQIKRPLLVKADRPYYLVRFGDGRLAAVFSIGGTFEELRLFQQPLRSALPAGSVMERLREPLQRRGFRVLTSGTPELVYRPEMSPAGRIAPVWQVPVKVADAAGRTRQTTFQLDLGGELLRGLEPPPNDR